MIFEVKQDARRKARLVAGGHLVDPKGISFRSTVIKGISVRLPVGFDHSSRQFTNLVRRHRKRLYYSGLLGKDLFQGRTRI